MKEAYAHVAGGLLHVEIKTAAGVHVYIQAFSADQGTELRAFLRDNGIKDMVATSSTVDHCVEYGWPANHVTSAEDLLDFGLNWSYEALEKGIMALRLVLELQSMTENRKPSTSCVVLDPMANEQVLEALKGLEGL